MNTPLTYYGGKTKMLPHILPLIPSHTAYVEPFFGGGSVFWAKPKSNNEVINDIDGDLTNFYMQLQTNFLELQKLIRGTLHSEVNYKNAQQVLYGDKAESKVNKAWAYWVLCTMTFSHIFNGGFAFGEESGAAPATRNKRLYFDDKYLKRIEIAEIFCRDAVELIELKDTPNTFFYTDPPYVSSVQGHYKGYTRENFATLLQCLSGIKGKFLLSSYPEDDLLLFRDKYKWQSKDIKKKVVVTGKRDWHKYKIECLTFNYSPPVQQLDMFNLKVDKKKYEEVLNNTVKLYENGNKS